MKHHVIVGGVLLGFFMLCGNNVCQGAAWETGMRIGFDTNISRAVTGETSDYYGSAYASFEKEASGETRLEWIFGAALEGTAYNRYDDLNCVQATVAPGFVYHLHHIIALTVSPFLEAKAVGDSDQNALGGGGKVMLREQIHPAVYLGQYYVLRVSSAAEDTYSFAENAVGIFAGAKPAKNITAEVGYEYSHGDSYRAVAVESTSRGKGGHRRFSQTFNELIIRESVDRHAVGVNITVDWTASIFSTVTYVYASIEGDSGRSLSHAGSLGVGYRF